MISTMDYETPRSYWEGVADRVAWYDVEAPHARSSSTRTRSLGEVLDTVLRETEREAPR